MAYTLIKGVYHIVGYSPDGDSIKFRANNNARWDKIITDHRETFEEKLAAENGVITLRLQGIDALETHYSPPTLRTPKDLARSNPGALQKPEPGGHKQPSKFGQLATAEFLRLLGVNNVEWRSFGKNTWISNAWIQKRGKEVCVDSKHQDNIPGYIVTDDVEKNGRPIAWVFPGSARERDGSTITADRLADRLEQSANYHLLQKGLVYPYFFMTLPARLRDKLAGAARQAQQTAAQTAEAHRRDLPNLWAFDKTVTGVNITTLSKITDDHELVSKDSKTLVSNKYGKILGCLKKQPHRPQNRQ